jgi:hypothetical protein
LSSTEGPRYERAVAAEAVAVIISDGVVGKKKDGVVLVIVAMGKVGVLVLVLMLVWMLEEKLPGNVEESESVVVEENALKEDGRGERRSRVGEAGRL